ncbi:MAG TPA: acyl-CoA dehydrogenase family protein [Mycobacteriales bacterium]|jgi:alkylation response protein AidB-like acyl-CoA dehydrogenase|nr:acyl-CoA dehydrogenase family protein [Mycobacteriales bacterium]
MQKDLYTADHEAFRDTARGFVERYITPHHDEWESEGLVDRGVWVEAGKHGLLGFEISEQYGGGGVLDFRYNAVLLEELIRAGASGIGFGLHNDVCAPYFERLATDEQKARWMPGFCSGELISAIAMTEPAAGSDLQGIKTTAVRDGDDWIVNGQKTFITNGINSDLVIVVVRTDTEAKAARGTSLLVVERGMAGFERGRNLHKVGMKAQDTAELFFTNVRVPANNVLGELNGGFIHLMENLPQERLSIAVGAVASAETVLASTIEYCKTRTAFGKPIGSFQNSRFVLAELATEVEIARVYLDRAISEHNEGRFSAVDAAMAKWWTTELQKRVIDSCLQLHGGYGYMLEYPVAKAYIDTRVQTIYGGTTEIMKEIVGRSLGV